MTNVEVDKELFHSQAHIWNHIFNFINSMSLKCAVQLGIPDIIHKHGQPMTLSELVAVLNINQAKSMGVYRLMRILVHSGFFVKQKLSQNDDEGEEEGYLLTPVSRLLLNDEPLSVRPFLLGMLDPIMTKPWHYVSQWFQNDNPTPFETAHGRTIWDYAGHETIFNHFFNDAMASDARLVTSVVIKECKEVFEGLNSMVDVAGGTGALAKAIANSFPHLQCTVLDLPHVVAGLQGTKNLKYVAGDMFEAIPPADAVLLKWILHDWRDEESVRLLKKCKEAIPSKDKGGKVIIIDMVVENEKGDDKSIETQLFFDVLMMVLYPGRERNKKEWEKLFFDAGFSDYKITPMGLRSLIEVYP
ncbi:trans-resveratrol di-O-methyltransferase-like [Cornus florida]|uniref:trans-resveratrol di-O-methyltransferase-like n=1 Tax=Cornus florida TaxID=4283 RepID=UPI00289C3F93|nr:trans-resveratrol di-O-methyltransferase-like [Cornus florida]